MHDHSLLDRRSLIQRAMLIVAGAAVPIEAGAKATGGRAVGKAMTPAQFKLCSAIADTIVPRTDTPGALDAGVPKLFDGLLRDWASPDRHAALVGALDAIDADTRQQAGKGFADLPPAKRETLLKAFDAAALKPVPRTDGKSGLAAMLAGASVVNAGYAKLKELIVLLYYYSEPALTHELPYEHAPGAWQPSIPVTPDTRPFGGPSLL